MAFDVQAARRAGYSDAEIADFLAGSANFDAAGARRSGYSDAEIIAHLAAAPARAQEEGGIGRWLGLAGRAAAQGVSGFPSAAIEALPFGIGQQRLGARVAEAVTGERVPAPVPTLAEGVARGADAIGLPRPVTPTERAVSAGIEGAAAVLPTMGAGLAAAPSTAGRFFLSGNPLSQLVAGASGGVAAQQAEAAGYGPLTQAAAGVVGGLGGAAAAQGARAAGNALAAMAEPFRQPGRERMVADVLLRSSSDPAALPGRIAAGLADDAQRLPGSPVTTAQAARDPSLLMVENSVRQGAIGPVEAARLRDVDAARNAARNTAISGMSDAADPATRGATIRQGLRSAEQAMADRVDMLFRQARSGNVGRFSVAPVLERARAATRQFSEAMLGGGVPAEIQGVIDDLARAGTITLDQAQNVRARLGAIEGAAARAGNQPLAAAARQISAALEDVVDDPRWMAAVAGRREMGRSLGRDDTGVNAAGRILARAEFGTPRMADQEVARTAIASPQAARQVLQARLKALEDARRANLPPERIADLADQLRDMRQAMRGQFMENLFAATRTSSDAMDSAGRVTRQLSPAQFQRFWDRNAPVAAQLFDRREMDLLRRLANDFAETSAAMAAGSTRNSQTVQNLTVGNLIARATNGLIDPTNPLAQTIGSVGGLLRYIYRPAEDVMRDMLAQALADPQFARMLLARATPGNIRRASNYIEQNIYGRIGQAVTIGAGREAVRAIGRQSTPPRD